MTKQQAEQEFEKLVAEAVELLKPIVENIEKSPPNTKYHYGAYMALLGQAETKQLRVLLSSALIRAGANSLGVGAALKLLS